MNPEVDNTVRLKPFVTNTPRDGEPPRPDRSEKDLLDAGYEPVTEAGQERAARHFFSPGYDGGRIGFEYARSFVSPGTVFCADTGHRRWDGAVWQGPYNSLELVEVESAAREDVLRNPTVAAEIASKAHQLVGGDRAKSHGDKWLNHQNIAHVWNGILRAAGKLPDVPLDAHDVANLMEGLKIARRYAGAFNLDDYVDGAGYAAVAGEVKSIMNEMSGGTTD